MWSLAERVGVTAGIGVGGIGVGVSGAPPPQAVLMMLMITSIVASVIKTHHDLL